jgi:hypothetical protein
MKEKFIYSAIFIAIGILGLISGNKLREAQKWAWITAITFSFLTLGSHLVHLPSTSSLRKTQ